MNLYQLDKNADDDFLQGIPVICKVAVSAAEYASGKLTEGEKIVIRLSNGAKYMGRINSFHYIVLKDRMVGDLEIVRVYATKSPGN
ncbi:MAG: hypothetical protein ACOYXT_17065 [Bacteroidota bacterium]